LLVFPQVEAKVRHQQTSKKHLAEFVMHCMSVPITSSTTDASTHTNESASEATENKLLTDAGRNFLNSEPIGCAQRLSQENGRIDDAVSI